MNIYRARKGLSPIIEMVFTLPLFLGIFFAISYFSITLNQQITLNNITREAVRVVARESGMENCWNDMVNKMMAEATGSPIDISGILNGTKGTFVLKRIQLADGTPDDTVITSENMSTLLHFHDRIKLDITYKTQINTIFFGKFTPTLHSSSTYLVEYVRD